ncbi:MAG TPA: tripartite tricarboxylate transporter substrate binding protein [Ideonella sp.]|nr:tripartite tricarboxylate transporter substrate binding protein [Ideonella sp.]
MKSYKWLLCAALAAGASFHAAATDFPARGKTIRLVVGLPAGGPSDAQARVVAAELQKELGSTVVVDNKPGASMMLASLDVARAAPDGYTLLYTPSSAMAQVPHTLASVQFDPFKDFTPISVGGLGPLVLVVHKSLAINSVKELVAYAKAHPGKLNYASFGTGTSSHLYGLMFAKQAGIDIVHIPYKGSNDVAKDFISSQVQMQFATAPSALGLVKAGAGHIIGLAAPKRTELLPGLATMAEQGITGVDIESWIGFFGPANMPPEVVSRLNAALVKVLALPQVKEEFRRGAWEAMGSTPAEFAGALRTSYDQWGKLVAQVGFKRE